MLRLQDGTVVAPTHLDVTRVRVAPHGAGWRGVIEFAAGRGDDTATISVEAESLPLVLYKVERAIMDERLVPFRNLKLYWGRYRLD